MLGERLKALRIQHKYSQQEVSKLVGISRSTYAGYEKNYAPPDINIVIKLAKLYDTSTDYILLGLDDEIHLPSEFKEILLNLKPDQTNSFWLHLLEYAKYLSIK